MGEGRLFTDKEKESAKSISMLIEEIVRAISTLSLSENQKLKIEAELDTLRA